MMEQSNRQMKQSNHQKKFKRNLIGKIRHLCNRQKRQPTQVQRIENFILSYNSSQNQILEIFVTHQTNQDIKGFLLELRNYKINNRLIDKEELLLKYLQKIHFYQSLLQKRIIECILFPKTCQLLWKQFCQMTSTSKYQAKFRSNPNYHHQNNALMTAEQVNQVREQLIAQFDYFKLTLNLQIRNSNFSNIPKAVLICGNTGAGKSTIIQFQLGYNVITRKAKVLKGYSYMHQILNSNSIKQEHKCIVSRGGTKSTTADIHVIPLYSEHLKQDIYLVDTPGYNDTEGIEVDIVNNFLRKKFIGVCKQVKIIEIVEFSALLLDKSNGLRRLAEKIAQSYIYSSQQQLSSFMILLFNKCQRDSQTRQIRGLTHIHGLLQQQIERRDLAPKIKWAFKFIQSQACKPANFIFQLSKIEIDSEEQITRVIQEQKNQVKNIFQLIKERKYVRSAVHLNHVLDELKNSRLRQCIEEKKEIRSLYLSKEHFIEAEFTHRLIANLLQMLDNPEQIERQKEQLQMRQKINQFYQNLIQYFTTGTLDNFEQIEYSLKKCRQIDMLQNQYQDSSIKQKLREALNLFILSCQNFLLSQQQEDIYTIRVNNFVKLCRTINTTYIQQTLVKFQTIMNASRQEVKFSSQKLSFYQIDSIDRIRLINAKSKELVRMQKFCKLIEPNNIQEQESQSQILEIFATNYRRCVNKLIQNLQSIVNYLQISPQGLTRNYDENQKYSNLVRQFVLAFQNYNICRSLDFVQNKFSHEENNFSSKIQNFCQLIKAFYSSITVQIDCFEEKPQYKHLNLADFIQKLKKSVGPLLQISQVRTNVPQMVNFEDFICKSMEIKLKIAQKGLLQIQQHLQEQITEFVMYTFRQQNKHNLAYIKNIQIYSSFLGRRHSVGFKEMFKRQILAKIIKLENILPAERKISLDIFQITLNIKNIRDLKIFMQEMIGSLNLDQEMRNLQTKFEDFKLKFYNEISKKLQEFKKQMNRQQLIPSKIREHLAVITVCFQQFQQVKNPKFKQTLYHLKEYVQQSQKEILSIFQQIDNKTVQDQLSQRIGQRSNVAQRRKIKQYEKVYAVCRQIQKIQCEYQSKIKLKVVLQAIEAKVKNFYQSLEQNLENPKDLNRKQFQQKLSLLTKLDLRISKRKHDSASQTEEYLTLQAKINHFFQRMREDNFEESLLRLFKLLEKPQIDEILMMELRIKIETAQEGTIRQLLKQQLIFFFNLKLRQMDMSDQEDELNHHWKCRKLKDFIYSITLFENQPKFLDLKRSIQQKIGVLSQSVNASLRQQLQKFRVYQQNWDLETLKKRNKKIKQRCKKFNYLLQQDIEKGFKHHQQNLSRRQQKMKQIQGNLQQRNPVVLNQFISLQTQTLKCYQLLLQQQRGRFLRQIVQNIQKAIEYFKGQLSSIRRIAQLQQLKQKINVLNRFAFSILEVQRFTKKVQPLMIEIYGEIANKMKICWQNEEVRPNGL